MRGERRLFRRVEAFKEDEELLFSFLGALVSHSPEQGGESRVCAAVFHDVPGEVHTTEKDVDTIAVDRLDRPALGMMAIAHERLNGGVELAKEREEVAEGLGGSVPDEAPRDTVNVSRVTPTQHGDERA